MVLLDKAAAYWKKFIKNMKDLKARQDAEGLPLTSRILVFWSRLVKFKKIILAIPVGALSIILAMINLFKLPALVGIGLQADGTYSFQMIREVAVVAPMVVTVLCLMLMFASKRTLTPWMVSMLSLLLPVVLLITNTFPG